jgi:HAMP domain-containing protein
VIVPLLARVPLRHLLPLSLVAWAAVAALISALAQMHSYDGAVETDMRRSLGERMNLEQQRIEVQHGRGNLLQVRRIVASLGMLPEVTNAWLTDSEGRIIASLRRAELGKRFAAVLEAEPATLRSALLEASTRDARKVQFLRPDGAEFMVGHAAVGADLRLLLAIDLARPLRERLYASRGELWIEIAVIVVFAALLAVALHRLWFRRMRRMTEALHAIGNGRLDTRISLAGRDELAQLAQSGGLLRIQGERRDALGIALFLMLQIGFDHLSPPHEFATRKQSLPRCRNGLVQRSRRPPSIAHSKRLSGHPAAPKHCILYTIGRGLVNVQVGEKSTSIQSSLRLSNSSQRCSRTFSSASIPASSAASAVSA